jgi:solute carrier family 25 carnitine/acylcarnitine transporter 20/29
MEYYIKGGISGMFGILLSHPIDTLKTHRQINHKITPTIKNLYKGLTAPLIGVGIEKAIVFGTYNFFKNKNTPIPVCGAISGLTASIIVSPYERIKILKQTNQPIHFKFLFKGLGVTFTREVPGFAIYFKVYEELKTRFYSSVFSSFLFGGIAGATAWVFIYPQDRIKTIIQSTKETSTTTIFKNLWYSGGFYKGFSFALYRAVLLHSGTFFMMELLQ